MDVKFLLQMSMYGTRFLSFCHQVFLQTSMLQCMEEQQKFRRASARLLNFIQTHLSEVFRIMLSISRLCFLTFSALVDEKWAKHSIHFCSHVMTACKRLPTHIVLKRGGGREKMGEKNRISQGHRIQQERYRDMYLPISKDY